MMNGEIMKIAIDARPSFTEVWTKGSVFYEDKEYEFWLIDPQGEDEDGREYECEVRWFFKRVPMIVRAMYPKIIEAYKMSKNKAPLN